MLLLFASLIFAACNNTGSKGTAAGETKTLKGRFVNTDNGIHSFTFRTDGFFERGGAVSGTVGGTTDYVAGTHDAGKYELAGETIHLVYTNGDKEDLPVEIFPSTSENAVSKHLSAFRSTTFPIPM